MSLEACFQEDFSGWDKIEIVVLCPNKRTHREIFNEHVDEILDSLPLELTAQKLSISIVTKKELEQLYQDISFVLNKVWEKIEGQKRGVTNSKEKSKRRAVVFHWKARLLKDQCKPHSRMAIENREQCVESELNVEKAEIINNLKRQRQILKN